MVERIAQGSAFWAISLSVIDMFIMGSGHTAFSLTVFQNVKN